MSTETAGVGRVVSALDHDFCPWANRWVYWMKRPFAALLLAAIAAGCCAFFVGAYALVPCAALLLVLFLGYCWPWIAVRGLQCSLKFEQTRATEGQPVNVRLRIENRWPFPVWGLSLRRGEADGSEEDLLSLARVSGSSTSEFTWNFVPPQRGEYPSGTTTLGTAFPFGLKTASTEVDFESRLLVWPRTMTVETLLDSADVRPSEECLSEERIGDAGDVMGTRPFRDGDSLRRVHWGQTARHGRLIVCERQAPALSTVRILIDTAADKHVGRGPDDTLEWSIRVAATLAETYHAQHAHVECALGDELVVIGPGRAGFRRFLDRLAAIPRGGDRSQVRSGRRLRAGSGLTIHVGTDLSMHPHGAARSAGGQLCTILLRAAAFDPSTTPVEAEACGCRPSLVLDQPDNVERQFRAAWRRVCHVG